MVSIQSSLVLITLWILQGSGIPSTITEGSSSYESSDGERIDHVEYDESDEVSTWL